MSSKTPGTSINPASSPSSSSSSAMAQTTSVPSVHTTCRCGNVSIVDQDQGQGGTQGSSDETQTTRKKDEGEGKSMGFGLRIIKEELTAHRRTTEWLTRRESAVAAATAARRDGSVGRQSQQQQQRSRRASNDFPKQPAGDSGSGSRAGSGSGSGAGAGAAGMGTSGGRGRRASRSAGALDDGDEEEDGERILVCTVCEEDVVKVKVRVGEGGKVVGTEEILEILCEKRTPPTADMETKHALLYPFDLSHLPSSESYGAPPNLPTPPHFTSLLSPLADPFFLPPPFTPSDPYFMQLSKVATEKIKQVRDRVDREILEFVGVKRKEVASVQRRARGECEILWKSYEKACKMRGVKVAGAGSSAVGKESMGAFKSGTGGAGEAGDDDLDQQYQAGGKVQSPAKESFGDPSLDSKTGLGLIHHADTSGSTAATSTASRMPIRSSVAPTGYGSSLLSASLHVSYFPQNQHQASLGKTEDATTTTSTSRPAGRSPMKSPQTIEQSFQSIDPVAANGGSTSLINSNPITAPFHRGARSGLDLDVVSSLRISHMDERFGVGGAAAAGVGGGGTMGSSRAVTTEAHHSVGRKGNRYHNPLDTDLDVEADDPSPSNPHNNNNKLDKVVERQEDVREGGEGDITLHPFAESSQVSAASSYKDTGSEDESTIRSPAVRTVAPDNERLLGAKEPEMLAVRGRRPSSLLVPEEERTPRPRNVKHLSSSSPETMRKLAGSAGNKRSSMGGTREANAAAERKEDDQQPVPAAARKKVKFDEAVVEKDDKAQSDKDADDAEQEGGFDDAGLISGPEDAVFDFEDHDLPPPKLSGSFPRDLIVDAEAAEASSSPSQQDRKRTMEENTQLVEKKLIQLMAADAPSHRSAWRNDTQKLWQALGQTTNRTFISPSPGRRTKSRDDSEDEEDEDESRTSVFATSMPVEIAMPQPSGSRRDLEPKTSLVDRQGMLVPPLKKAMRGFQASYAGSHSGRRIEGQNLNTGDLDGQDVSISASVSNIAIAPPRQDSTTRSQGRMTSPPAGGYSMRDKSYGGFSVDPGPALEAMGTLSEEEEDAYSGSVRAGAPGFIPPHRQDRST